MKLSYSRASTFDKCPLAYKFTYVDEAPSRPMTARDLGIQLHAALALAAQERSLTTEEVWNKAWPDGCTTSYSDFVTGLRILQDMWPVFQELLCRNIMGIEKSLIWAAEDNNGYQVDIESHLDLILGDPEKALVIVDYKTGNYVPTESEANNSLQKNLYLMAVRAHWPQAKKVKFVLWYVRSNTTFHFPLEDDPEEVNHILDYLFVTAQKIEHCHQTGEWAPKMNEFCSFCDFRASCPLFNDVIRYTNFDLVKLDPTNPSKAIMARDEVCNALKILEALKDEIDGWIKSKILREGAFKLGEATYDMIPYKQADLPIAPILHLLEQATGRPKDYWMKVVGTVNKSALDRELRTIKKETSDRAGYEALAQAIEGVKQPRPPSYRLHISRPKK